MASLVETQWEDFLASVRGQIGAAEFENWFANLKYTNDAIVVPNIFVQEYILTNYKKELAHHFQREVRFSIQEAPLEIKKITIAAPPTKHAFNPLYTFGNFIEGSSNQFVRAAAMGVAQQPGKTYNPLFIYGGVGLGKTHLLHAIGQEALRLQPSLRVDCLTAEEFVNALVEHLRNRSLDQLKKKYRTLDLLLLDDMQFLHNRPNFEEEFIHTFEALVKQGKQIVLTSDKPPAQIQLSERLAARMQGGLTARIGLPDVETRAAILQHKAHLRNVPISESVALFLAERLFGNVRQLEGAIARLGAHHRLLGHEVTRDGVESALGDLLTRSIPKRIGVDQILTQIATLFDVSMKDLQSQTRAKAISFPRQVAMYLAKELLQDSLTRIANAFGGKTHSTLLHAWKSVRTRLETDETLRQTVDQARRSLVEE